MVLLIFFFIQKRMIEKSLRHLKDEVQELEDLVAAIIEEFEDIAGLKENEIQATDSLNQGSKLDYPTVSDFLDNLDEGDLNEKILEGSFTGAGYRMKILATMKP
jgi:hypothetical protein